MNWTRSGTLPISNNAYIPALDGLRAVAVALVVAGHGGLDRVVLNFLPGGFGVTLFFFISGLLISRLLIEEFRRSGHINLPRFYFMRFLRLAPALFLYVAIAGAAFTALGYAISPLNFCAALLYWVNYFSIYVTDVYGGFGVPPHPDVPNPFIVMWSLGVEEHFYLLFPAMLVLFVRRRLKLLLWLLIGLCGAALAWRGIFLAWHCSDPASNLCAWAQDLHNYRASDARFDSILFGVIATVLLYLAPERSLSVLRRPAVPIMAVLLLMISFAVRDPMYRASLRYTVQDIALIVIVPAILYTPLGLPARLILSWRPMLYLGRLSYTLYLFHWLAKGLASYFTPAYSLEWYAIFVPVTVIATLACYHFVEMPVVSVRRRFGSSAPAQSIPHAVPEESAGPACNGANLTLVGSCRPIASVATFSAIDL